MIALATMLLGFGLGYIAPPSPYRLASSAPERGPRVVRLTHPQAAIRDARERLAVLDIGAARFSPTDVPEEMVALPAPLPVARPPLRSPPPPVDVAAILRRDLTAVLRPPDGPALLLVDGAAPRARQMLRPGDAYREGWALSHIDSAFIVLRRRGEVRRIPIGAGPSATSLPAMPEAAERPATGAIQAGPIETSTHPRRRLARPGRVAEQAGERENGPIGG
ncbi:hypothetical protein [Sphingomonas oleivorans]|uniref:hypothetical protein n=1 Tax=Sphingomonas oleivorans TaxID=1735121 RepID=UPI0013FD6983|nr:hypothetical protein [Sphingomonas oleivorans]